jgi:hypothetical protein
MTDEVKHDPAFAPFATVDPQVEAAARAEAERKRAEQEKAAAVHKPEVAKVDHHVMIEGLALQLKGASPSMVEDIANKMLVHLGAIKNPKEYDARIAAEKKAEDELEAQRAKERAKLKKASEADKLKVA